MDNLQNFHQNTKIVSLNELLVDHDYFPHIFNSNTLPKLSGIKHKENFVEGGYDQNLT